MKFILGNFNAGISRNLVQLFEAASFEAKANGFPIKWSVNSVRVLQHMTIAGIHTIAVTLINDCDLDRQLSLGRHNIGGCRSETGLFSVAQVY
jgi:hypothetical protein